jgi:Carboxypeptidase regulatory-like domain/TonB dependent receptor
MVRLFALPRVALFFIVVAAWSPSPARGQAITATLQGVVRDVSRAVLPGATVTLRDLTTGFVRTTTTDTAGSYVLSQLPAGMYDLSVELSGFKTVRREAIRFQIGQETTLDVALEVGGVAETVTVRGEAPLVEVTKSSLGQTISREQIDSLPLPGRQASSLALLVPGVVQRGTSTEEPVGTGGQPRGSGETLVDGVSTELMAVNSIRSTTPPDAVQEFQVITNQYQAEFGNATGVILNTITRSGTNDLHGRIYYFQRDEALDARNAFATSEASFEQKQTGGWLGGPIVRDRTHYFVSYEATRRLQIATVTSPVAPGDVEQPFDNNQILGKVTHQFNANNRLTGRFGLDRPERDNVGVGGNTLEEVGFKQLSEDLSYVGHLTSVLSNRALNEVRVQLSDARSQLDPKRADVFTIMRPTSTSGKASNVPQAFPELRFQLVDNYSYEYGRHRIKVGIDFNRVVLGDGYVYQNTPGVFQFDTDRPFDASDLTTYPRAFVGNEGDPNFRFVSTGVAAFAQDAWHLPRNVTLNLGLRYDAWDVTGLDLQKSNFAPRLSAAWDPFGTNKTVIRAGYGVFYNNVLTNVTLFTTFLANQRSIVIPNPGYPDPFSRGTPLNAPLSTYIAQPDQPLPVAYHTTAGFQREIGSRWSVGADYVNSRGRDLIRIVDTNPTLPPAYTSRIDPTRGFVRILESTGYSDYDGLLVNLRGRVSARDQIQVAYTLASYKTTTEADNNPIQQDDLNKNDSYGYGDNDQRHRLVVSGYVTLPWDIQLGGVLTARSGVPFNITTGTDINRNSVFNERPNLAPGARVGTDDMKDRSSFVNPGLAFGDLPRNAGRRPAYWTLDARIAKRFRIGPTSIEGLVEAFNLTNRVNYNGFVGNLSSGQFGRPNTAFDARQVQLGVRFEF